MEAGEAKGPKYELMAGRWIYREGQPFFALQRPDIQRVFVNPSELDDMARWICQQLNDYEERMHAEGRR